MKPFANEPVLELRRASARAGLADALAALGDAPGQEVRRHSGPLPLRGAPVPWPQPS